MFEAKSFEFMKWKQRQQEFNLINNIKKV